MSVYVSFSDESRSADGKGQFLIAGYVAQENKWPAFSKYWDEEILKTSPKIPYIHMTDIRSKEWREQHNISREQANQKVEHAVDFMTSCGYVKPYLGSVLEPHYLDIRNGLKKQGFDLKKGHNHPDYPAFCAYATAVLNDTASSDPTVRKINFFISQKKNVDHLISSEVRDAMIMHFTIHNPDLAKLIGDITPLSMENNMPLQAADVLCWHIQRVYSDTLSPDDESNIQKLRKVGICMLEMTEQNVEQVAIGTVREIKRKEAEADRFSDMVSKLLKIPKSDILEAIRQEEQGKQGKRKKSKKSSASGLAKDDQP